MTINNQPRIWDYINRTNIIIGIIAGIIAIFGTCSYCKQQSALQLTVFIHGANGHQDIILRNTGELTVDFRNRRDSKAIDSEGRINFGEIPDLIKGDSISFGFKAQGFQLVNPKKKYKFTGEPIYLEIKRDLTLAKIEGKIYENVGKAKMVISNVRVDIGIDTFVLSDTNGVFKIVLPENLQKQAYKLTFSKNGYETYEENYVPNSSPASIPLKRLKKQTNNLNFK